MYYDMHVHSDFSTDSTLEMESGVRQAISLGLSGISFTDHLDIDFTGFENEFHYDFNEYFSKVNSLKDKYSNKIDILSAVEIGFQPHVKEETLSMIKGFEFDYIIGSTHLIKKQDPYYPEFFDNRPDKNSFYNEYLNELYSNLLLFSDLSFNTLGHLDYVARYVPYEDKTLYYNYHSDIIDTILKFIINKGVAFEINTSTYLKATFDVNILKRYKELGGNLITIGSDAHKCEAIGQNFKYYADLLYSMGFKHLNYFKNGIPYSIKIN